jgi:hypothetical protein
MGVARKPGSSHLILLAVGAAIFAPGAVTLTLLAQGCGLSHEPPREIDPVAGDGGSSVDGNLGESDARDRAGTGNDGGKEKDTTGDAGIFAAVDASEIDSAARDGVETRNDGGQDRNKDGSVFADQAAGSCAQVQADITLQGNVIYDDYQSGFIEIYVFEWSSYRCTDDPHITVVHHPGDLIGELELDEPGPFGITVTVTWLDGGKRPDLAILAIHKLSDEGKCEGGGLVSLSGVDQDDIEIVVETANCPTLE